MKAGAKDILDLYEYILWYYSGMSIAQAKGETLGAKKHASKMDHIVKTSLKFTLWFFHLLQQLTAISEITLYMGTQNEDRLET